jgi:dissimilatory sulfite reductase (desulfoviridin) alpha/beta subunit
MVIANGFVVNGFVGNHCGLGIRSSGKGGFRQTRALRDLQGAYLHEICSAQALMPGEEGGTPEFDREKCIHCGACIWSCCKALPEDRERANIEFGAGSGGLHSNEN